MRSHERRSGVLVLATLTLALLVTGPGAARAEDMAAATGNAGSGPGSAPPEEAADSDMAAVARDATSRGPIERVLSDPWRFAVVVWGWLPEAPADIKLGPAEVELPESLDTILDTLQYAGFLDLEVRKGPFGAYAEPIVIGLRDSIHVGPRGGVKVTVNEEAVLMDFGLSYELGRWDLTGGTDSPSVTVEPFVGGRWLFDDITLDVDPGRKRSVDVEFVAPVVGLRTFWDLTERWNLRLGGDYGGFDVDDLDETYNLAGTIGYRFMLGGVSSNVFVGYRYLYIDYEKEAELEVTIKGPVLGIGFEF